jgi:hypothetical protein
MNWQDELHRLDAEMAAGYITKQQHRKVRDELLASASSATPLPTPAVPDYATTPESAARNPAVENPTAENAGFGRTSGTLDQQQLSAQGASVAHPKSPPPLPPIRVHRSDPFPHTQYTAPSPADHERTVAFAYPVVPPGREKQSADPPIYRSPAVKKTNPPQEILDSAHSLNHSLPNYSHKEQDYSREQENYFLKKKRPLSSFVALGALVVLVVVVGGFLLLGGGESPSDSSAAPAPRSDESFHYSASDVLSALPLLAGAPDDRSSTMSVDKAVELNLLTPDNANILKQNGGAEFTWKGSSENGTGYIISVAALPNNDQAKKTTGDLVNAAIAAKYQPAGSPEGHSNLTRLVARGENSFTSDIYYTSGNYSVRVTVLRTPLTDEAATVSQTTLSQLDQTTTAVLAKLPES